MGVQQNYSYIQHPFSPSIPLDPANSGTRGRALVEGVQDQGGGKTAPLLDNLFSEVQQQFQVLDLLQVQPMKDILTRFVLGRIP